jgi:hypothetical protein
MAEATEKPTHFWRFDENRRVYPPGGSAFSSPIWREHWRREEVVGETSRSWLVGRGRPIKLPKKGPLPRGWARNEAEVDENCWEHEHRHRIQQHLNWVDAGVLRQIAKLINYPET